jgi:TPR repeat protein
MPMSLGTCGGAATYTERGRGTTRDPKRAWHFLRHGCDQGEARSCARMGAAVMRESHPDPTRARALYDRACALGNAEACEAAKNLPAGAGR